MAKRRRRPPKDPPATVHYRDAEGNVLTLRESLSPGTIRKLGEPAGRPGASAKDVRRRREEMLFEHLAVRWEIAGLPITEQAMLLGRYRLADPQTRDWVRRTIDAHLREHVPELAD